MRAIYWITGATLLVAGCKSSDPVPAHEVPHEAPHEAGHEPTGAAKHTHLSQHGGIVGMSMAPALHVEALRTADEVRVYVSDDAEAPIPVTETSGKVRVKRPGAPEESLALDPDAKEGYLSAKFTGAGVVSATFDLVVRKESVSMELDLPAPAASAAVAEAGNTIEIAGHLATLVTTDDSVSVTVTEKGGGAPESARDAKLILQIGAEKKTVALAGSEGKFSAKADLKGVTKFVAVLQISLDGKSQSGRFSVDRAAPAADHDHAAHDHSH